MTAGTALARFAGLRATKGRVSPAELGQVWSSLDVVRPEEILGDWKGSEFDTGHPLNGQLQVARWYGKRFVAPLDAKPLMCLDDDGELYDNAELAGGGGSLWMVEFRGEITASMMYDGRPVIDHFKQADSRTLLGVMNGKGVLDNTGNHFYFILDRV